MSALIIFIVIFAAFIVLVVYGIEDWKRREALRERGVAPARAPFGGVAAAGCVSLFIGILAVLAGLWVFVIRLFWLPALQYLRPEAFLLVFGPAALGGLQVAVGVKCLSAGMSLMWRDEKVFDKSRGAAWWLVGGMGANLLALVSFPGLFAPFGGAFALLGIALLMVSELAILSWASFEVQRR